MLHRHQPAMQITRNSTGMLAALTVTADKVMSDILPPFLSGCFDWRANGYHWYSSPPIDLLSSAALRSTDPWVVLASVVEHAKAGDHDKAVQLVPFFFQDEPWGLSRVAMLAFGEVAPSAELGHLERVLRSSDVEARLYAAEAAALSGALALVPAMVQAWARSSTIGDHESIGFKICDMLESEPGPIGNHVSMYNLSLSDPDPFPIELTPQKRKVLELMAKREALKGPPVFIDLVEAECERLRAALGDDAYVWTGAPLDVNRLVARFLAEVKDPSPNPFINMTHRFQAWTGEPTQRFFYAYAPHRGEMAAALEDFIRSGKGAHYQPGRRYFFGHPVP